MKTSYKFLFFFIIVATFGLLLTTGYVLYWLWDIVGQHGLKYILQYIWEGRPK